MISAMSRHTLTLQYSYGKFAFFFDATNDSKVKYFLLAENVTQAWDSYLDEKKTVKQQTDSVK